MQTHIGFVFVHLHKPEAGGVAHLCDISSKVGLSALAQEEKAERAAAEREKRKQVKAKTKERLRGEKERAAAEKEARERQERDAAEQAASATKQRDEEERCAPLLHSPSSPLLPAEPCPYDGYRPTYHPACAAARCYLG